MRTALKLSLILAFVGIIISPSVAMDSSFDSYLLEETNFEDLNLEETDLELMATSTKLNATKIMLAAGELITTHTTPLLTSQLLIEKPKAYIIGYTHVGRPAKAGLTITSDQALKLLAKDIKDAAKCVAAGIKRSKYAFSEDQAIAMVSFVQAVPCALLVKYVKSTKISATSTIEEINAFFASALAKADELLPASAEHTARRDAERALFGITALGSAFLD